MAINDGVFSQVSGTVGRIRDTNFTIEVQSPKAKYPDYVTVWGPDIQVTAGDRISVKGWLSWKKNTVGDKVYVDVSVNKPEVVEHEKTSASPIEPTDVPF
jgi:hypothetical protein